MTSERPRPSTLGKWFAGVEILPTSYEGMSAVAIGYRQSMPDGKGGKVAFRSVMAIVDRPGEVPSSLAAPLPEGEPLARVLGRLPARTMAGE